MWWMTVTADGSTDYLVKRILSVLPPPLVQHRYSRSHTHASRETEGQRSIHTIF